MGFRIRRLLGLVSPKPKSVATPLIISASVKMICVALHSWHVHNDNNNGLRVRFDVGRRHRGPQMHCRLQGVLRCAIHRFGRSSVVHARLQQCHDKHHQLLLDRFLFVHRLVALQLSHVLDARVAYVLLVLQRQRHRQRLRTRHQLKLHLRHEAVGLHGLRVDHHAVQP